MNDIESAEDVFYDVIAAQNFDGETRVVVMNDSAMEGDLCFGRAPT